MAIRRSAWVLNLDADIELASPKNYAPNKSVLAAMMPHVDRLAPSLLGKEDILVDDSTRAGAAIDFVGRAFCPTPRALDLLRRAGATPEPHPTLDVLTKVNSRGFASSLGPTLPHALFVTDLQAACAHLESDPEIGEAWRIKRAFGMAGRGQRVRPPGPLTKDELAFLRAALAEGGVQIEPNVNIDCEHALHGWIAMDGSLRLGVLVRQSCDRHGAWLSTAPHDDPTLHDLLETEARRVAHALTKEAYFGPFGIDSYVYRDRLGASHVQTRSEINARYSMGYAVGMGPMPPLERA